MSAANVAVIWTTICCCGSLLLGVAAFAIVRRREARPPWRGPDW